MTARRCCCGAAVFVFGYALCVMAANCCQLDSFDLEELTPETFSAATDGFLVKALND
jgi:hypothetical protein